MRGLPLPLPHLHRHIRIIRPFLQRVTLAEAAIGGPYSPSGLGATLDLEG
jgi:hypothetical protein